MPRAIYTEAHTQTWLDIALRLRAELDLEPVYWVGKAKFAQTVAEHFPDAVFHARTDAIRGVPAPALADLVMAPLDAEVLAQFSHVLLATGKMMDRVDVADGFRIEERARLFHVLLRYWRAVLDRFRPDLVLFPVQPHTIYDYVLYELCKARGIRTSMFQWTILHDRIYPLDDIDSGYAGIRERYRQLRAAGVADVTLDPVVEEYVRRVGGDYRTAIPDYLVEQMPAQLRVALFGTGEGDFGLLGQQTSAAPAAPDPVRPPDLRTVFAEPRRARKLAARYFELLLARRRRELRRTRTAAQRAVTRAGRRLRERLAPSRAQRLMRRVARLPARAVKFVRSLYRRYLKLPVRSFLQGGVTRPLKEPGRRMHESFGGPWGGARLQYLRALGHGRKRELMTYYHERCSPPDFSLPYIFVALHYQPEQTTSPTGGVFVDQQIMVDMLSHLVPEGWRIYVKEHPFQFFPNSLGERGRSEELYDDLSALPNVTLVPWSVTPFDLIDHARAVATISGTSGIEAAIRGKPVLVFGYAWYRDCPGVFHTPTVERCRDALARVAGGISIDPVQVRLYLKAVEESCVRADMDFGIELEPPVPHDDNVTRLAAGIRDIFERGAATAAERQHATQVLR